MIVCIICKNIGNYYTNSDSINSVMTSVKNQLPLNCWWYNDFGKKLVESIVFYDEEQILAVRSESDASPLEEM